MVTCWWGSRTGLIRPAGHEGSFIQSWAPSQTLCSGTVLKDPNADPRQLREAKDSPLIGCIKQGGAWGPPDGGETVEKKNASNHPRPFRVGSTAEDPMTKTQALLGEGGNLCTGETTIHCWSSGAAALNARPLVDRNPEQPENTTASGTGTNDLCITPP